MSALYNIKRDAPDRFIGRVSSQRQVRQQHRAGQATNSSRASSVYNGGSQSSEISADALRRLQDDRVAEEAVSNALLLGLPSQATALSSTQTPIQREVEVATPTPARTPKRRLLQDRS
jgi:hypothetical protein